MSSPDDVLGAVNGDARQQGGGLVQGLDRKIGARRDHAAVNRRRLRSPRRKWWRCRNPPRSRSPVIAVMRRHGVDEAGRRPPFRRPVGMDARGPDPDWGPSPASGSHLRYLRQNWRRSNKHRRDHRGDDRPGPDRRSDQLFQRQKLAQPSRHIRRRCATPAVTARHWRADLSSLHRPRRR